MANQVRIGTFIYMINPDNDKMRRWLVTLMTLLAIGTYAQRQQISYIEETKYWYYVYDEQGKKIGGLSRSSVGELKGWGSDFFVAKRYSYYHICDAKGKTLKTMNVSDVGEILGSPAPLSPARKEAGFSPRTRKGKNQCENGKYV